MPVEQIPPPVEIAPGVFLPPGARADSFIVIDEAGKPTVLYTPSERPDGTSKAREFHACTIPNVLLHGPRGTGKSTILRFDAHMRAMASPGFTYLIVRRTMPQLRKSHLKFIDAEMKKLGGRYNKTENVAYYPEVDGLQSKGFFSHCESAADVENLLSSEFNMIIFDELTTFTLDMFLKISACVRAPVGGTELVRAGTNPLGESTGDMMRYFITKTVTPDENADYDPSEFHAIFVGAEDIDERYLDMVKYRRRLSQLSGGARKAWLDGVWEVEGAYFGDFQSRAIIDGEQRPWHVIDRLPTVRGKSLLGEDWISIYRCIDSGFYPDPAVCIWIAVMPNGRAIAFKEETWLSTTADAVSKEIFTMSARMKIVDSFCDPTMFATSNHTGLADSDYYEQNGIALTPSRNDRAAAGKAIHEWFGTIIDAEPKLQILRPQDDGLGCPQLIRTIPDMQMDKNDPRKIGPGNDHYVIALAYFCQGMTAPSRENASSVVKPWMRAKPGARHVLGARNVHT